MRSLVPSALEKPCARNNLRWSNACWEPSALPATSRPRHAAAHPGGAWGAQRALPSKPQVQAVCCHLCYKLGLTFTTAHTLWWIRAVMRSRITAYSYSLRVAALRAASRLRDTVQHVRLTWHCPNNSSPRSRYDFELAEASEFELLPAESQPDSVACASS